MPRQRKVPMPRGKAWSFGAKTSRCEVLAPRPHDVNPRRQGVKQPQRQCHTLHDVSHTAGPQFVRKGVPPARSWAIKKML